MSVMVGLLFCGVMWRVLELRKRYLSILLIPFYPELAFVFFVGYTIYCVSGELRRSLQ